MKENLSQALKCLDQMLLRMGDSFEDYVEGICYEAGLDYDVCDIAEDTDIEQTINEAYNVITEDFNNTLNRLHYWNQEGEYDYFLELLKYEQADDIADTDIYKSFVTILHDMIETQINNQKIAGKKDTHPVILDEDYLAFDRFMKILNNINYRCIKTGYQVGQTYFKKLHTFGVTSNDCATVGHIITSEDITENPEYEGYSYVFYKDINLLNAPQTPLVVLFKTGTTGDTEVRILLGRYAYVSKSCIDIVDNIYDFGSICFDQNTSVEEISDTIAKTLDEITPILTQAADEYTDLYSIRKQSPKYGLLEKEKVNQIINYKIS